MEPRETPAVFRRMPQCLGGRAGPRKRQLSPGTHGRRTHWASTGAGHWAALAQECTALCREKLTMNEMTPETTGGTCRLREGTWACVPTPKAQPATEVRARRLRGVCSAPINFPQRRSFHLCLGTEAASSGPRPGSLSVPTNSTSSAATRASGCVVLGDSSHCANALVNIYSTPTRTSSRRPQGTASARRPGSTATWQQRRPEMLCRQEAGS